MATSLRRVNDAVPTPPTENPVPEPAKDVSPKGERTRALILETAMRLFEERGYDKTTMRAIAQEAGVSVGNAYHYFASKEHLIQGFYNMVTTRHSEVARAGMEGKTKFADRLDAAVGAWLDVAQPYHQFGAQVFKNAADPDSPLNPFSEESHPAREIAVQVYREVLLGSTLKVDDELAEVLPELLWLHEMGIVLFWVFDRSPDAARTRAFVKRTTPMVARVTVLSRYKVFRPLVRDAVELISDFIVPRKAVSAPLTGSAPDGAPAKAVTEPRGGAVKRLARSRKRA